MRSPSLKPEFRCLVPISSFSEYADTKLRKTLMRGVRLATPQISSSARRAHSWCRSCHTD